MAKPTSTTPPCMSTASTTILEHSIASPLVPTRPPLFVSNSAKSKRGIATVVCALVLLVVVLNTWFNDGGPFSGAWASPAKSSADPVRLNASAKPRKDTATENDDPLPDEPPIILRGASAERHKLPRRVGSKYVPHNGSDSASVLPQAAENSIDEMRLRLWQAERLCVFVPTEAIDENSIRETTAAMRSWGDHRTFLVEFKGFFLAEAERTHAALLAALQRSRKLASDPEAWVAAAVAMARTVGNATLMVDVSTSVIPPSLLLVPPIEPATKRLSLHQSLARPAAWQRDPTTLTHAERVRAVINETAFLMPQLLSLGEWRLRDPRDAVLVIDEQSPDVLSMGHVFKAAYEDKQSRERWLSKEAKSVLMWDYVTRMLHWPGRADGQPASADREALWATGFSQCEWVMKADTDTYVNRPALRENELLGLHNLNGEPKLKLFDPRRDPAYFGLMMSFGHGDSFLFGGLGYYFSRAALLLVLHESIITFRSCAHHARYAGKDVMLFYEDAMIGRCVFSWNEKARLGISVHAVYAHRVSIGNATNMMTAYLSRRHKCLCCMRALHKVDGAGHDFIRPLTNRHCFAAAPTSAGGSVPTSPVVSQSRGTMLSAEAWAFCSQALVRNYCPWKAFGSDPITFADTGVNNDAVLPAEVVLTSL
jgi:hypothetical protein